VRSGAYRSDNADCADSAKRSNHAHSAGSDTAVAARHTAYHADNSCNKHGANLPDHA
jgi:hypothetical protein